MYRYGAKELASNLPSTDDIIRAIGLRRHESHMMSSIALFGAGLLVGAGLALLFAPSSGRELREQLGERTREAAERGAGMAGEMGRATQPQERYGI